MELNSTDILLAKWIAGDANTTETIAAESWIAASEENRKQADILRLIWKESEQAVAKEVVDEQEALKKLRQRIAAEKNIQSQKKSVSLTGRWMQAAAIIIIVLSAALVTYRSYNHTVKKNSTGNETNIVRLNSGRAAQTDSLPDGTLVLLDPQSELSYTTDFNTAQRNTRFSGTAFFMVAHNALKPFHIAVADLTISVLGTSFRVSDTGGAVAIAVRTGVVEVSGRNQRLKLYAHDILIVSPGNIAWMKQTDSATTPRQEAAADQHKHIIISKPQVPGDDYQKQLTVMRAILAELVTRHIVNNISSIEWAGLSDTELIVNDVKQPVAIQKIFRKKYLPVAGEGYYYGPVKMHGKGYFFNPGELK